jgi:ketosteroid isomerase-like protein
MKKYYFILSFVLTSLFILSCNGNKEHKDDNTGNTATGFDIQKARAFIDSINTKWSEELKKGDSIAIASHYSQDGKILLANSEPASGSGILSLWGGIIRSGVTDWKFTTTDLTGDPHFLIETGSYEINGPDKKLVDKGNYVVTWKKQDNGEWKLYRDIGVSSMPASK